MRVSDNSLLPRLLYASDQLSYQAAVYDVLDFELPNDALAAFESKSEGAAEPDVSIPHSNNAAVAVATSNAETRRENPR